MEREQLISASERGRRRRRREICYVFDELMTKYPGAGRMTVYDYVSREIGYSPRYVANTIRDCFRTGELDESNYITTEEDNDMEKKEAPKVERARIQRKESGKETAVVRRNDEE